MKRLSLVVIFFWIIALCVPGFAGQVNRIKNLYVEQGVSQYFEIVAFAPGSGWVKVASREVMRPILSFNKVSPADLQRFNGYASGYGVPVKAEISAGILYLVRVDTDVSRIAGSKTSEQNLFWEPEPRPRLAIIKDDRGKIFVVKKDIDIRMAEKEPKKALFQ